MGATCRGGESSKRIQGPIRKWLLFRRAVVLLLRSPSYDLIQELLRCIPLGGAVNTTPWRMERNIRFHHASMVIDVLKTVRLAYFCLLWSVDCGE
jgi:hypothetical protein